jgi:hypothetical protein
MNQFCIALMLATSLGQIAHAEDLLVSGAGREHSRTPKRVWIRRATLVAGCAASLVFDTLSTRRAINAGAIEGNGLLSNGQGNPNWGAMIGLKAGLCGASAVMEETRSFHAWKTPNADWTWTSLNLGTTAVYTWAGFHNLNLANTLTTTSSAGR